jgi:hypothetical protein
MYQLREHEKKVKEADVTAKVRTAAAKTDVSS